MRIFILEDDSDCSKVIEWIKSRNDEVKVAKNMEDMAYFLEYEEEYRQYDKFVMDASLPGATILHLDGEEAEYDGALNGIDYMLDNFSEMGIELRKDRVAILTAFANKVHAYLEAKGYSHSIKIIDKNDNQLKTQLKNFLKS